MEIGGKKINELSFLGRISYSLRLMSYSKFATYDVAGQSEYEIMLYFFLGLAGVLGNIATCIVIANNRTMRTITNAYLFNLAISDLLILVFGFPPWNRYVDYRYDSFCKLRSLMTEWPIYVSVLTITVFSVERYLAICHPFKAHVLSDMSRVSRAILAIWLLGFFCALPMSLQINLVPKFNFLHNVTCVMSNLTSRAFEVSSFISSIVFFVLPMLLICCLYTLMGIRLRNSGLVENQQLNTRVNVKGKKVIRMLVIVAAVFFVCWAPFHSQRLFITHYMSFLHRGVYKRTFTDTIFSRATGLLYYSSAVVNPIIYNIMSNKFRQAFKGTLIRAFERLHFFR
ncbi:pyrokinin/capa receptor 2 [Nasonia vitripennis]|uniref:G-protein coupled receptors family 1 profile domain-containing protein n=1 Tax=Nasonia vitripennis TaxID=7425 RepID=A0A7M6UUZ1_NASVI|nr:pyrokinin/capa receptor 2 [Nasonia vitripennis]